MTHTKHGTQNIDEYDLVEECHMIRREVSLSSTELPSYTQGGARIALCASLSSVETLSTFLS